jgi:LysM repeat protein
VASAAASPPPASPKASAKPSPSAAARTTYTVQKGDTLFSIARRNDVTVAELASANGLTASSTIKIGQRIRIP